MSLCEILNTKYKNNPTTISNKNFEENYANRKQTIQKIKFGVKTIGRIIITPPLISTES